MHMLNIDSLATELRLRLLEAAPGTILAVYSDGSIIAQGPTEENLSGNDRRRRAISLFTARRMLPEHSEIVERLRQGLRRSSPDPGVR